jgi:hypothetical protein
MTRQLMRACFAVLVGVVLAAPAAHAAQAPAAAGHWKGAVSLPQTELAVEIDLLKKDDGWAGAIAVPAQGLSGVPLTSITVEGKAVSFVLTVVPGSPTFKGQLSDDGATLAGDFAHGEVTAPFKLARAGEASIAPAAKSTAITKDIEGTWAGVLDVKGNMLRLTLKLAAAPDGTSSGVMVSVDQGGAEIPIHTITQTGTHLEFIVLAVGGKYVGDLKEGRLVGTWSQGPGSQPLEFARVP